MRKLNQGGVICYRFCASLRKSNTFAIGRGTHNAVCNAKISIVSRSHPINSRHRPQHLPQRSVADSSLLKVGQRPPESVDYMCYKSSYASLAVNTSLAVAPCRPLLAGQGAPIPRAAGVVFESGQDRHGPSAVSPLLRNDDQLAGGSAGFHIGVCFCNLVESVNSMNRHHSLSGGDCVEELL